MPVSLAENKDVFKSRLDFLFAAGFRVVGHYESFQSGTGA
jgi:hypothetical protein